MNKFSQANMFELDIASIPNFPELSDSFFSAEEEAQAVGEKFIVFLLDETQYAIPAASVSEVIRRLELTNLFNVPEWFLGIANLRGDIVSVIDLQQLMGKDSTPYTPKSKLIVLHCEKTDSLIAFKVDKLREIVTLSSEFVKPSNVKDSVFFKGITEHKSGKINLLNVENILCSLKFN